MQRSLRDIAALYNCEASLEKVEKFRSAEGLKSIGSKCFQAANISVILIDDGIAFDKMLDLESHKAFAPVVGRVLRIERLAETIINDVSVFLLFLSQGITLFFVLYSLFFLLLSAKVAWKEFTLTK
jgi:hypothetical protein